MWGTVRHYGSLENLEGGMRIYRERDGRGICRGKPGFGVMRRQVRFWSPRRVVLGSRLA